MISSAITAFFTAISKGFEFSTKKKDVQSETDVLKDLKRKRRAVNWAEKLIFHIEENYDLSKDKTYQRMRKNFFRNN